MDDLRKLAEESQKQAPGVGEGEGDGAASATAQEEGDEVQFVARESFEAAAAEEG